MIRRRAGYPHVSAVIHIQRLTLSVLAIAISAAITPAQANANVAAISPYGYGSVQGHQTATSDDHGPVKITIIKGKGNAAPTIIKNTPIVMSGTQAGVSASEVANVQYGTCKKKKSCKISLKMRVDR